ncbi:MAG: methyltransferase, TIGR04325 family [Treponema sp.]|jgi:putative methyltransferase (TIGR04325 family)|nr:methyltransferase, TIGR04325 family [Treponema sp.]
MLNGTNIFLVAAIHNYFSMFPSDKITILDFGGACGSHYFETRRLFPHDANLKWIVTETPGMVESARIHGIETEELVFIDELKKIDNPIAFVHSSGALQYVPDPWVYLKQLMDLNPKYMLFNRMMFNENDRTFVTIQKSRLSENGPGPMPEKYNDRVITYPHTTISYKEFTNIIT